MINRVRSALGRFVAFSVALITVSVFAVASAAAQGTTGKIQGTVTDQAGTAIARAQVVVVGTAFGAVTDDKGYYFINNVPVGTYSLKSQFIGYSPLQQDGARVLGGQTVTFDFKMTQSSVAITGLLVTTQAVNALVPRDQVTSKSIVSGSSFQNLPVSSVRTVITLQPGVVESNSGAGVSIRGGRPGEANVYIDGAPVRALNSGAQGASLQTNAVEEASVTTGGLGIEFGDAQSGVIQFTTKSGGDKLGGSLSAQSDGINGGNSMGYSRFEGTINGPVPMVQNLKFFLSGEMDGQQTPFRPLGADQVPTYTIEGIDTTVTVNTATGVQSVAIPRFVQYSGSCDAAKNFGFACQGARQPMNWTN
ncbi:MAG TPA: carboxypeptidase regulatory-like domain-containing protein, partial [Gemmatimonadales bacterium]|nr:carboxypeptidase regulatory-like domain-containing protein [Gemmatimonadales bacterium]